MNINIKYLTFTLFVSQVVLNNAWSTDKDIIEKPTTLAHRTLQTAKPTNFKDCMNSQDGEIRYNGSSIFNVIHSDHAKWQKFHHFINEGRKFNAIFFIKNDLSEKHTDNFTKKGLEFINTPEIFTKDVPNIGCNDTQIGEYPFIQVTRGFWSPTKKITMYGWYTPEVKAYMLNTPGVEQYDFERTKKVMTQLNQIPSKTVSTMFELTDPCLSDDLIMSLNGIATLKNTFTCMNTIDLADIISHATTNPNLTFNEATGPDEIAYLRPRGKRAVHRLNNFDSYMDFICCAQEVPTEVISIISDMLPFVDQQKVIPPKSQFTQEREEQEEAYEKSLRADQEKDRLAQEKSHIIQTYPAVIQAEEEKYESLKEQAMQKTRELQQMRYDLPKNPQNQQGIDALTAEIATLTDAMNSLSHSIDESKAKLEDAQNKQ